MQTLAILLANAAVMKKPVALPKVCDSHVLGSALLCVFAHQKPLARTASLCHIGEIGQEKEKPTPLGITARASGQRGSPGLLL